MRRMTHSKRVSHSFKIKKALNQVDLNNPTLHPSSRYYNSSFIHIRSQRTSFFNKNNDLKGQTRAPFNPKDMLPPVMDFATTKTTTHSNLIRNEPPVDDFQSNCDDESSLGFDLESLDSNLLKDSPEGSKFSVIETKEEVETPSRSLEIPPNQERQKELQHSQEKNNNDSFKAPNPRTPKVRPPKLGHVMSKEIIQS